MQRNDFAELAGRIEGVARALMLTIATLENEGRLDGPAMSAVLRRSLPEPAAELLTAGRTLQEIARALDDARAARSVRRQS